MTTTEQIELVEAWAWLRVGGGLPIWDEHFGGQRENMEIKFFGHMRWRYTHVKPRWFTYALWSARMYQGEEWEGLVEKSRSEIRSKFTRKIPLENPLDTYWVEKAVENLPPMDPPFDDVRRLTKMVGQIKQDDWSIPAWFKMHGLPLNPDDLRDFRRDLTRSQIVYRISKTEEQFYE